MIFRCKHSGLKNWHDPLILIDNRLKIRFVSISMAAFLKGAGKLSDDNNILGNSFFDHFDLPDTERERLQSFVACRKKSEDVLYIYNRAYSVYIKVFAWNSKDSVCLFIPENEISSLWKTSILQMTSSDTAPVPPAGSNLSDIFEGTLSMLEVFDSLEDFLHVTDAEYRIRYMNKAMRARYPEGWGNRCFRVMYGLDEPCSNCKIATVRQGKSIRYEYYDNKEKRLYDVVTTPLNAASGDIFHVSLIRDITQYREQQNKEKVFLDALENSTNLVAICDTGGTVSFANNALAEYLEVPKEDLIGQNIYDLYQIEAGPVEGREYQLFEKSRETVSGRSIMLISLYSVKNHLGEPAAIVSVAQDISAIKNLENRFEEERNYFKNILDNSIDGFFIMDGDSRFIQFNKSFQGIFRDYPGNLRDASLLSVLSGQSAEVIKSKIHSVSKKVHSETSEIDLFVNNMKRFYLISLNPLTDEKGHVTNIYGFIKNITEIKRLQHMIENERNYNRSIIETVDLGFVLVDDNDEYLDYNRAYLNIIDRSEHELVGRTFYDFTVGDFRQRQEEIMHLMRTSDKSLTFEKEYARKDGTRIPVLVSMSRLLDKNGKPIGTFAFIRDISEQKRIERELIEKNRRILNLINVYNTVSARLLNAETIENVFEAFSDSVKRIINLETVEIFTISRNGYRSSYVWNLPHRKDDFILTERLSLSIKRVLKRNEQIYIRNCSEELNDEDLSSFPYLDRNISAIFIPVVMRGDVTGIVVISFPRLAQDPDEITFSILLGISNLGSIAVEKINSIMEHNTMKMALDRYERLTVMGRIIAGVAHEINNPLSIMQFDVDELRGLPEYHESDELKELLNSLQEEIKRMSGIVTQLKDYSKPEAKEEDLVCPDDVLKNYPIKILLKNFKKKGLEVQLKLDAPKSSVQIPRNRLIQVLMNILNNADEAIADKKKGQIRIETARIDKEFPQVMISIKDNGMGITQENLHKIFEPFFTTKKSEGTGLGLPISYSIIKNYNGEVEVVSRPGEGAEFIIFFREH